MHLREIEEVQLENAHLAGHRRVLRKAHIRLRTLFTVSIQRCPGCRPQTCSAEAAGDCVETRSICMTITLKVMGTSTPMSAPA